MSSGSTAPPTRRRLVSLWRNTTKATVPSLLPSLARRETRCRGKSQTGFHRQVQHYFEAGDPIRDNANLLFRRGTDRFVKERIGKQPLDVGADRIARTAHAALRLLAQVRTLTGSPIPLAWNPKIRDGVAAIEVYPAATLTAHGLRASGYKSREDEKQREEILRGLAERMEITADLKPLLKSSADALDAAVCVLAGADFLGCRALAPSDPDEATREGWIWVAGP